MRGLLGFIRWSGRQIRMKAQLVGSRAAIAALFDIAGWRLVALLPTPILQADFTASGRAAPLDYP
jgi:hypothetical protein